MLAAQRLDPFPGIEEHRGAEAGRQLIGRRENPTPGIEPGRLVPILVEKQAELAGRLRRPLRRHPLRRQRRRGFSEAAGMKIQELLRTRHGRIEFGEFIGERIVLAINSSFARFLAVRRVIRRFRAAAIGGNSPLLSPQRIQPGEA